MHFGVKMKKKKDKLLIFIPRTPVQNFILTNQLFEAKLTSPCAFSLWNNHANDSHPLKGYPFSIEVVLYLAGNVGWRDASGLEARETVLNLSYPYTQTLTLEDISDLFNRVIYFWRTRRHRVFFDIILCSIIQCIYEVYCCADNKV